MGKMICALDAERERCALVALEWTARAASFVALVSIAVHSVAESNDGAAALAMAALIALACAYSALAFRIRMGASRPHSVAALREAPWGGGHPYREGTGTRGVPREIGPRGWPIAAAVVLAIVTSAGLGAALTGMAISSEAARQGGIR